MRRFSVLTTIALLLAGMGMQGRAQTTSCTGLCLQQTMCTGNATTSISGKVFAPNGTDPLPNVTVYIPNDTVQPFTPGVSCPTVGAPPSGSPLVGAITAVDGSFTLNNAPVGTNIPIVAVSGRWRVQSTVNTTACANTVANLSMPQNQSQGDIPKIAIASGDVDQVECILRRVGISDSEFTDPTGSGRINIYKGTTNSGAVIDAATPTQASLMENSSTLNQYDVLMLPCQGSSVGGVESGTPGATELANFIAFANAGGRIYSSHFSYAWMYKNPPFNSVVNWDVGQGDPADGTATVNTSFSAGQTLSQWLQLPVIDASTTAGQMSLDTLRVDTNGVVAPTQSWLTLNNSSYGNPVMQFVFNTPLATTANPTPNQCGRVLFNEYHVENGSSSPLNYFPSECSSSGAMTPQEKLLEYMLFELTSDGGQPTLTPATQDFGSEAVNYPTAAQTFTWTNNSSFPLTVGSATITAGGPQFSIATDGCTNVTVAGAASCTVTVILTPSALGAASGTLTLVSGGFSQSASLTGTGVPGYSLASGSSLNFGNVVVGDFSSQTLTLTSNASGPQTVPSSTITANYTISTAACGATVAAGGSCVATVTFKPTALGVQTGTLVVNSSGSPLTVSLTGNGIPGFILSPATLSFGNVDVGATAPLTLTLTSVAQRSLATPVFATTGYYSYSTAGCGAIVGAQQSCQVTVSFTPPTTGPLTGTLADNSTDPVYSGLNATMSGNGVDFTLWLTPNSGTVIAGDGISTTATLTPIAGFNAPVTVSCTVGSGATAAACSLNPTTLTLSAVTTATASFSTTSQYTVIGYSGLGGRGWMWLVAAISGGVLWRRRRGALRGGLLVVLLGAIGLSLSGCTGKLPDQNPTWTGAGNYSVTVSATDGFLVRSATYSLTVTAK
jgi:hypothetical protein